MNFGNRAGVFLSFCVILSYVFGGVFTVKQSAFKPSFVKSFLQHVKPVVIDGYTMNPEQVPHYFQCNKPFKKCMNKTRTEFPCRWIQGANNSGKIVTTWECHNDRPPKWYIEHKKKEYKKKIMNCMESNKKCLLEKSRSVQAYWKQKEPETVNYTKLLGLHNYSKNEIKKIQRQAKIPKNQKKIKIALAQQKIKAKNYIEEQKRRAKVAKLIKRLGLQPQ